MQVNMPYHIRVLVPCYKESYDIVTRSLEVRTFRIITFQAQPTRQEFDLPKHLCITHRYCFSICLLGR